MKKLRTKPTIVGLLVGAAVIFWISYIYQHYPFIEFLSHFALMVATIAALAALLSLKYTRDTVRPFLSFSGTINLGGTPQELTLAFPVTNTGSMPADNVKLTIDPFGTGERISLDNVSKKYERFLELENEVSEEALTLFPNQTWQCVVNTDLTRQTNKQLYHGMLGGHVKLRITITYSSFGRKHKTIHTVAFDKLSFHKGDGHSYLHGISVEPQKWI